MTASVSIRRASRLAEETRTEPGCIAFRFSIDVMDSNIIYIHEEWESAEAAQRHLQTPGLLAMQQKLPGMVAAPLAIKHFEASEAHGP
jgi:quinol monooxygenase YgiN